MLMLTNAVPISRNTNKISNNSQINSQIQYKIHSDQLLPNTKKFFIRSSRPYFFFSSNVVVFTKKLSLKNNFIVTLQYFL